ncbi:MAG: type 1 glutamine amidotransferase [Cycloclasticus sp.]|nr:type 1 glutamine amidotransferase [Cycloclasticus sp.]
MKIHVLHHVHIPISHGISDYLDESSHQVSHSYLSENPDLPALADIDWLIIMGGPMNANDTHKHPWLASERQFIKDAIDAGKMVFGLCLGAQLIAQALGAQVTTTNSAEFGWHTVSLADDIQDTFLAGVFEQDTMLFHSHGDTFGLPVGAKRIASSEACENQGFIYSDNVVAIQFHPEITPKLAQLFNKECQYLWSDSPYYKLFSVNDDHQFFLQSANIVNKLLHQIERQVRTSQQHRS